MRTPTMRRGFLASALACACTTAAPAPDAHETGSEPAPERCAATDDPFVDPMIHTGTAETPTTALEIVDVVVDPPYVYACTGLGGLVIWDASVGPDPAIVAAGIGPLWYPAVQIPRCQHIAIDPDAERIAIAHHGDELQPRSWVQIFDVSDPSAPDSGALWSGDEASVEGLAFADDDRLYVGAHDAGLGVFADDGLNLRPVGGYADAQSDAWTPRIDDTTAVVAEGATGLRTYDISGEQPALLATVPLQGSAKDVELHDAIAHVATSTGVALVDVSDPQAPVVLAQTSTPGTALAVSLGRPGMLFVADWDAVRAFDVSEPSEPRLLFNEPVPSTATQSRVLSLDADGSTIYAGEWLTLQVLDHVGDPVGPDIGPSPNSLSFGRVPAGETAQQVLVLRNHGNRDLQVEQLVSDHAGVVPDATSTCVPAHAATAIEVSFTAAGSEAVEATLTVASNDPDQPTVDVGVTANAEGVGVGDPMPDFTAVDLDGNVWTRDDLSGHVTLLAYFATF